jgi:hypothetical protein
VVRNFYPFNHALGSSAAFKSLPLLAMYVTKFVGEIFIGWSMNHYVGNGTTFWAFSNASSEIRRGDGNKDDLHEIS